MTYTIDVKALTDSISDRALEQLCRENPDRRFETDKDGKLIIMSRSTYGDASHLTLLGKARERMFRDRR